MKKILLISILFSSFLFSEQIRIIQIDKYLLTKENGGNKSVIYAYLVIGIITESNQVINNHPMNHLFLLIGKKLRIKKLH